MKCQNCGTENPPEARFCMSCASPLERAAGRPRETRKTVTVVFCDMVGSTSLGERLDPETLRRVMTRFFEQLKGAVERHGGTVEKYIGDAVMAVFGLPVLHEDDALRAVRAATEIRSSIEELNRELSRDHGVTIAFRIGVNTGEVVAGDPSQGQTLATGDAINTAARLQQAASPGEILLGASTYGLVRDGVRAEPVSPLAVKGKADPVSSFRLQDVVPDAEAVTRRLDTPMVGREREHELLRLAFERASEDRACHLVTIFGSAGVGKSRLAEEFVSQVEATLLRGRCLPYGEGITYWPVIEIVRQAAGIVEGDHPDRAAAKLRAVCEGHPRGELAFQRVGQILGLTADSAVPEETFWAIRTLLEILSQRGPLVVVFDDVHWGEPTLLDLIEHLADWSHDAPMLLICLGRRELLEVRPGWGGGKVNATTVQLEPLDEDECVSLIDHRLGDARLIESVRDRIIEFAEGNPLFIEQMLAMMIDDELVRRDDGHWVAVGDVGDLTVPPSIHALLAARLDRLAQEERSVIERASVVGRTFYRSAIMELSPESERSHVGGSLSTLVRRELILPHVPEFDDDTYRFRNMLIRDSAYEAMPKEARADLHERFAGWLEARAGERLREYEEILGYHLEESYRFRSELGPIDDRAAEVGRRAGSLLSSAGRRAQARGDIGGAVSLLTRAVELLPPDDPERVNLLTDLAELLFDSVELVRARSIVEEAIDVAGKAGNRATELRARLVDLDLRITTDPSVTFDRAMADADRILAEAERLDDLDLLIRAQERAGALRFWSGQAQEAADLMERAIAQALERGATEGQLRRLYSARGGPTIWGPVPVDREIERWEGILDQGLGFVEADANAVLGALYAMRGQADVARSHVERADALWRELGSELYLAAGHHRSLVDMLLGDPAAAEARLRPGIETLRDAGETGFLSTSAVFLAEALYLQGKDDEALESTRVSEESATAGDVATEMGWRSVRAKVLARRGQLEEAERLAGEAVDIARRTDDLNAIGDCVMAQAIVLRARGDLAGAGDAAREAFELYELRGNVISAGHTRTFLGELESPA